MENAHLPFDKLMALSKVEGLRYPHPSSLRRTFMYASFLGISEALHMDIFHQPPRNWFFDSLIVMIHHFDIQMKALEGPLREMRRGD
jgi:hypothetical protein